MTDPAPATGPLKGLRVLELGVLLAGPFCAQLLGDMGAEVIKIERPGKGDDCRAWGPPWLDGESLWFLSVNRNKQSVTLDYTSAAGRMVLHDIVRRVDVVIVNLTDRVQKKLGVDHAALSAVRSDIVHVSLSGFGLTGARKDFPCYDLIAEGYSGIMDLTGESENDPQKVGTPAADMLAGQDLAMAVMAAIHGRARTGKGSSIDISMLSTMTRFTAPRVVAYLGSDEVPRRSGGKDSVIAIYQVFNTADSQLSLGLGNDAIWKRFWQAVGDPAFAEKPEYAGNAGRRNHRPAIVARISEVLVTKPRDEWLALFAKNRIPAGPINRVDEVTKDQDLLTKEFFYKSDSGYGEVPQVGLGITIDGEHHVHRKAPPTLGEDTEAILRERLKLSPAQIKQLQQANIVNE